VLANPEDVKARKGHKTDPEDSWWLAHLSRHAMIRPSLYSASLAVRELRDLTGWRKQLRQHGTTERNRTQKVLELLGKWSRSLFPRSKGNHRVQPRC